MRENAKIAIVGGGIAGASCALYLASLGADVTLFEKESTLVSGPPMCHLHAGGNLYREIDDAQCVALLKQSIELARFYPYGVDFRPTVLATPNDDPQHPSLMLPRLELLKNEYAKLVEADPSNAILGDVQDYYRCYTKEQMYGLKELPNVKEPKDGDEWMRVVAKNITLEKLHYPLILVQEYGLNMFRISASASLMAKKLPNLKVLTQSQVKDVLQKEDSFVLNYTHKLTTQTQEFDYLINAAGFRSGILDDALTLKRKRLVEFKASYVVHWEREDLLWPEIIFHGQRGTPKGMAQFTPYADGNFQLHGMTEDITLFENGLVSSSQESAQPKLDEIFLHKIDRGWHSDIIEQRTRLAIEHLAQFMPAFSTATIASKPLYGAQQIPGYDKTLRASEVSFESHNYARCEIVKASSILTMADAITKELIKHSMLEADTQGRREFEKISSIDADEVTALALKIAKEREYPEAMGRVNRGFVKI